MALINLQNARLGFGGPLLLDDASLTLEDGERVCLVGRNGTGKSTVLHLLAGHIEPDEGRLIIQQGLRIAHLTQEAPVSLAGPVLDLVADEADTAHPGEGHDRAHTVLTRLGLPTDVDFSALSGGMKRRVLLAKALASDPELLLLDEPTNHLDIDAIAWLESFLLQYHGALLFVTHDRMLIQKLATRIVDLDRGILTSWPGDYQTYLEKKAAALDVEAATNAKFDKRLAAEEIWIRQGIKARRTRNEGRVRALKDLRKTRRERREVSGAAKIELQQSERSGRLVVETENLSFHRGERAIIRGLSTTIMRGDKVGIIGPNGAGKTTLIRLLLGELQADGGAVKLGTKIESAYLDQHRTQLDEAKSVQDNVAHGLEFVTINGQRRHTIGYLQDFLFSPSQSRSPVRHLSGGERNRLLLARIFAHPSNVLILDEPTNDLDIETLELLEELLMDYPGTVLVVSHDRAFLNNVVTSTLVFEAEALVKEYIGGYDDWVRQRPDAKKNDGKPGDGKGGARDDEPSTKVPEKKKLTFKEKKELVELPALIEKLETEQASLHASLADPDFYKGGGEDVVRVKNRLEALEKELPVIYALWEDLESRKNL